MWTLGGASRSSTNPTYVRTVNHYYTFSGCPANNKMDFNRSSLLGVVNTMSAHLSSSRGVAWLREASYKLACLTTADAPEPTLADHPIVLLGEKYAVDVDRGDSSEQTLARYMWDAHSRFWFTYRTGFEYIEGTHFSSDAGWGCMMRSGQMILMQVQSSQPFPIDPRPHPPTFPICLPASLPLSLTPTSANTTDDHQPHHASLTCPNIYPSSGPH